VAKCPPGGEPEYRYLGEAKVKSGAFNNGSSLFFSGRFQKPSEDTSNRCCTVDGRHLAPVD